MNDLHGIVFACRSDANLGELTRPRNTCSLPFGGRYLSLIHISEPTRPY